MVSKIPEKGAKKRRIRYRFLQMTFVTSGPFALFDPS